MALAQSTLIQRVRRILRDTPAQQNGSVATNNGLSITVDDSSTMDTGTVLEFQNNGELVVVKSITNATTVVVYRRGDFGTTAAIQASGAIFQDPQFQYVEIADELDRTVAQLWPYLWKKASTTVTPSTTTKWFNLASDFIDLIQVTQLYGSASQYVAVYGDKDSGLPVFTSRQLPVALVASSNGITFPNGFAHASNTVYVDYRAKILVSSAGTFADLSDGLVAEAVVYGAAWHLVAHKEVPLTTDQDVSMGETPIGAQGRLVAAQWLETEFKRARNDARDELLRTIPPMQIWSP